MKHLLTKWWQCHLCRKIWIYAALIVGCAVWIANIESLGLQLFLASLAGNFQVFLLGSLYQKFEKPPRAPKIGSPHKAEQIMQRYAHQILTREGAEDENSS